MKRVRFTKQELELINAMAAIADAADWGNGDYMDWSEKTSAVFNSLRSKVWELLSRPEKCEGAR